MKMKILKLANLVKILRKSDILGDEGQPNEITKTDSEPNQEVKKPDQNAPEPTANQVNEIPLEDEF